MRHLKTIDNFCKAPIMSTNYLQESIPVGVGIPSWNPLHKTPRMAPPKTAPPGQHLPPGTLFAGGNNLEMHWGV